MPGRYYRTLCGEGVHSCGYLPLLPPTETGLVSAGGSTWCPHGTKSPTQSGFNFIAHLGPADKFRRGYNVCVVSLQPVAFGPTTSSPNLVLPSCVDYLYVAATPSKRVS